MTDPTVKPTAVPAPPPPPTLEDAGRLTLQGLIAQLVELTGRANDGNPLAWDQAQAKAEEMAAVCGDIAAHARSNQRFMERTEQKVLERRRLTSDFIDRHFPGLPA